MELKQRNCAASAKTAVVVIRIRVAPVVISGGEARVPLIVCSFALNPRLGCFSLFCVKAGLASAVGISCNKPQVWWCPYVWSLQRVVFRGSQTSKGSLSSDLELFCKLSSLKTANSLNLPNVSGKTPLAIHPVSWPLGIPAALCYLLL